MHFPRQSPQESEVKGRPQPTGGGGTSGLWWRALVAQVVSLHAKQLKRKLSPLSALTVLKATHVQSVFLASVTKLLHECSESFYYLAWWNHVFCSFELSVRSLQSASSVPPSVMLFCYTSIGVLTHELFSRNTFILLCCVEDTPPSESCTESIFMLRVVCIHAGLLTVWCTHICKCILTRPFVDICIDFSKIKNILVFCFEATWCLSFHISL